MAELSELRDWHNRRAKAWGQYACEGHKDAAEHQAAHVDTARILDLLARVRVVCHVTYPRYDALDGDAYHDEMLIEGRDDLLRELAEALTGEKR